MFNFRREILDNRFLPYRYTHFYLGKIHSRALLMSGFLPVGIEPTHFVKISDQCRTDYSFFVSGQKVELRVYALPLSYTVSCEGDGVGTRTQISHR